MKCPRPAAPLGWILATIDSNVNDERHSGGKVTATRLASCPRQVLIEDFVEPGHGRGLIFDPLRANSTQFGTSIHERIARFTPGGFIEWPIPADGEEPPILDFGEDVKIAVSGHIDFLSPDAVVIQDYKTASETSHKFKWQGKKIDENLVIQASIYKALAEWRLAKEGKPTEIKRAVVWYGAMTSAKHPAPAWFDLDIPMLPLREIGDLRPGGGKTSVRDIARMYAWALARIAEIPAEKGTAEYATALDKIINEVPMVGEPMFNGSKCSLYCGAAQPHCFGIAGRPVML